MALSFTEQQIQDLQTQLIDIEAEIVTVSQNVTNVEGSVATKNNIINNLKNQYAFAGNLAKNPFGGCGDGNLFLNTACGPGSYWTNVVKIVGSNWNAELQNRKAIQADLDIRKAKLKNLQDQKSSIQADITDLLVAQAAQTQAEIDKATAVAMSSPETIALGIEAEKEMKALELTAKAEERQTLIIGGTIVAVILGAIILFAVLRK